MNVLRAALGLMILISVAVAAPARAAEAPSPADVKKRVAVAEEAFTFQEYDKVIAQLAPLYEPIKEGQLKLPEPELLKILERLGAAYWFSTQTREARQAFTELLRLDPEYELDKLVYGEELVRFLDLHREDLIDLGVIKAGGNGKPDGPQRVLIRETLRRDTPVIAYIMPFGVGQFANGDETKGAVVLGLQIIGVIGTAATLIGMEGLKDPRQNLPREEDRGQFEILRGIEIASISLFGAAYLYSVVDGFVFRPPETETRERFETLPAPETGETTGASVHLAPGPGVGLGLSGTF